MQAIDAMAKSPGPPILLDGEEESHPLAEVVEVRLLLPSAHAAILEQAARQRALTVAQMIRQLIRDFLE